jgi:beta-galactosidase
MNHSDSKLGVQFVTNYPKPKPYLNYIIILFIGFLIAGCGNNFAESPRKVIILNDNWSFINQEIPGGQFFEVDVSQWETVTVPHDWAIPGPFDMNNDAQTVMVIEDGEKVARTRYGRTGGLPHVGTGWYRKALNFPMSWSNKKISIEFDGAMSNAKVYFNEKFIGEWPYGYSSFQFDLTEHIRWGDKNILAVRLENKSNASRWYPGAGIYRNVRLVVTEPVHIAHWGTYITTPEIQNGVGLVNIQTTIEGHGNNHDEYELISEIIDPYNRKVGEVVNSFTAEKVSLIQQQLNITNPVLWSLENPALYRLKSIIRHKGTITDMFETIFGFRYFEFTADNGFFLNGKNMKIQGVCLHHDLGPLGAAVNKSAIKRQLSLLKEMGCNAIRTSHNPPTPELLQLTDKLGFLVTNEAFDEWKLPKVENGYNTLWDDWAEKDLIALIHRDRNHPSVIMWSIGNEIHEQNLEGGDVYCRFLTDICHREDPTRPVTAGFDKWQGAIKNGFADIVDVVGWNYKPQYYSYIHQKFPEWKMYGSETASTVSSRGEYFFPAEPCVHCVREPNHCSSYDMEYPRWATTPDLEFAAQDSFPFMAGEFVWTGFDYLGEPTPYNEQWPTRSSYFGIFDLCGIPKDRFFLYQSKWTDKNVLHLLPHWNWEGKEGEIIPVHCYTNFNRAELFLNGKSLGIREKNSTDLYSRYRLIWDSVAYEPGVLKVVALDDEGKLLMKTEVQTSSSPAKIKLSNYTENIKINEGELAFVTVEIIDQEGRLCPRASNPVTFTAEGGEIIASGNGDPTNIEPFPSRTRKTFNGKCLVIIKPVKGGKHIILKAISEGLQTETIKIPIIN